MREFSARVPISRHSIFRGSWRPNVFKILLLYYVARFNLILVMKNDIDIVVEFSKVLRAICKGCYLENIAILCCPTKCKLGLTNFHSDLIVVKPPP